MKVIRVNALEVFSDQSIVRFILILQAHDMMEYCSHLQDILSWSSPKFLLRIHQDAICFHSSDFLH